MKRINLVLYELKQHIPFTAFATFMAIIIALILNNISLGISSFTFKSLHVLHIFSSSIVTAGLFYKYKKNFFHAIAIGITGSIIIGSLSDIIFPWFGINTLGISTSLHLPIVEMPLIVLGTAIFGSLIGIKTILTKFPHTIHVLLSVFASLFYILINVPKMDITLFVISFFIVFFSVIIPCCISDILFPIIFINKKIKKVKDK
jgi:hypothetical protein